MHYGEEIAPLDDYQVAVAERHRNGGARLPSSNAISPKISPAWRRANIVSRPSLDDAEIFTLPLHRANRAVPGSPLTNSIVPFVIRRPRA